MLVTASAASPPPPQDDFNARLRGPDKGLINAWLVGLNARRDHPGLAAAAEAGQLPPFIYKGGIAKKIKSKNKIGALHYLAAWQGLRGEDLHLDTDAEISVTCSKTGVPVTFTLDVAKLFKAAENGNDD